MKILVIIPAYNESSNIVNVIEDVKMANSEWDILVVNDCSKDNTGELAEMTHKASVINLPANLGIGGGVQTGFKYAKKYKYDIALQLDGDGQHKAVEIFKLIGPIILLQADVVIGSRFIKLNDGFKSTGTRRIGIKIFEWVNSIIIGQKVTDNTSGFRAYNQKAIHFLADNYPTEYPEPEAVVLLGRNGFKIKEVSVKMVERQGGKSSIFGWKSIYYMIRVLLGIMMNVIRRKLV